MSKIVGLDSLLPARCLPFTFIIFNLDYPGLFYYSKFFFFYLFVLQYTQ